MDRVRPGSSNRSSRCRWPGDSRGATAGGDLASIRVYCSSPIASGAGQGIEGSIVRTRAVRSSHLERIGRRSYSTRGPEQVQGEPIDGLEDRRSGDDRGGRLWARSRVDPRLPRSRLMRSRDRPHPEAGEERHNVFESVPFRDQHRSAGESSACSLPASRSASWSAMPRPRPRTDDRPVRARDGEIRGRGRVVVEEPRDRVDTGHWSLDANAPASRATQASLDRRSTQADRLRRMPAAPAARPTRPTAVRAPGTTGPLLWSHRR